MPPEYTQSYHNHTIPEFCLILDAHTNGFITNPSLMEWMLKGLNHTPAESARPQAAPVDATLDMDDEQGRDRDS